MNTGTIIGLFTIFTIIWGGGLFVVDTRNEARSIVLRDSLKTDMKEEVGKYQNIYTLEDIITIVNGKYLDGFSDIKLFLNSQNNQTKKLFTDYVLSEKKKYNTFVLEEYDGSLILMEVVERKDTIPLIRPYLRIK